MASKSKEKSIKGTLTEANVVAAYVGESTAYSRYTYYAKQAKKESYFPIEQLFKETADNELHHGKIFLKMLRGGVVEVAVNVDAVAPADTATNLEIAISEECREGIERYTEAAKVAEDEGFTEIAEHFKAIVEIEKLHLERFKRYLQQVNDGTVWKRDKPIKWRCSVCGYVHEGTEPPEECPACDHPREHYVAQDMD